MLLDSIRIDSQLELNDMMHLLLDNTEPGTQSISLSDIAESNLAIGIELAAMLMSEFNATPQQAWHCTVSILRMLPWRVDPERANPQSEEEIVQAIYQYFGGLQFTKFDHVFDSARRMAHEGKPWKDISKYACENFPIKV